MYVEFGIALASNVKTGLPKIYVVGKKNDQSQSYFHPNVHRVSSIEEAIKDIGENDY